MYWKVRYNFTRGANENKILMVTSFISGIYFKYDISAFKVIVNQDRESIWQFLLKLCSGVGGIIATSQMLCDLIRNIVSYVAYTTNPKEETLSAKSAS